MLGFVSAVLLLSLWAVVGWLVTFPAYWWLLPDSALPDGPWGLTDTWGEALAGAALGIVLAPLVAWIGAGLARGQALLARFVLGPGERSQLEHRVGELTRTRAAAVDAQTSELRRIERDLHDGAQARMVAVTMDLGRARDVSLGDRLPTAVEVAAHFVVSESLVNVQKHADAGTRASASAGYASELLADGDGAVGYLLKERVGDVRDFVAAVRRADRLIVEVADDGRGSRRAAPPSTRRSFGSSSRVAGRSTSCRRESARCSP